MTAKQTAWVINTIYILRNKCNNKIYIGQTWQTLEARWRAGYNHCVKIQNAINKYGKENFYYEILTFCGTEETANYWESYFISKFDSIKSGYNIKEGGQNSKHSQATKNKLSKLMSGRQRSKEYCENISKSKMGPKNGMYGVKYSEKHKQYLKNLNIGSKNKFASLNDQQINEIRHTFNTTELSCPQLSQKYNVSVTTILRIVKNETYFDPNYYQTRKIIVGKEKKLNNKQIEDIKTLFLTNPNIKGYQIAKMFNVSPSTISCIKKDIK